MNKKILKALDEGENTHEQFSAEEQLQLTQLRKNLSKLKKASTIAAESDYFDTLIPRFRAQLDSDSVKQIPAFSFSPFDILRLAAGAVLPVLLVFYFIQSQGVPTQDTATVTQPELSDYTQVQSIEEMALNNPAELTESVNNSIRELISEGSEDIYIIMRESPATEGELDRLLQESDLDDIIAQLENKKIL